ncbi:NAD(P)-dependent dehydrogenase, short-chain alcohol dehydrogenase family [Collimonas sp. OK307]|uniref:SDR family NAD(P)-dependent oxidoreductase n=1 Tax=Collimonas sp. OK307 TaxID=1801620 RepID=UPI0008E90D61|nr:SDR family oxidoreductase [Collimonas sp. OK307]SFI08101.1 NAD(P)-dependent dehydrogenase, short-chain alcohol dehydrogenase family [Collimonas sp. OK307]
MIPVSTYFPLKNKVALITGSTRGMALHIACALSSAGARLAILDEHEQEGFAIAKLLGSAQGRANFWQLDVSNNDAVRRVMAAIEAYFGRIDILVNCAGVDADNPSAQGISIKQWDKAMQLNVSGSILCTKYVIAAMERAGGGTIVNVLSLCSMNDERREAADHVAKAALRIANMNAMRYAAHNIRINSIHPCVMRPPTLAAAMREQGDLTQVLTDTAELRMLAGKGSTTDVAAGILYLVSDASRFVTGSELVIDAGSDGNYQRGC